MKELDTALGPRSVKYSIFFLVCTSDACRPHSHRKVRCPSCGIRTEAYDLLGPYRRATCRFEHAVAELFRALPGQQVAEHSGLSWYAVGLLALPGGQAEPATRNKPTRSSRPTGQGGAHVVIHSMHFASVYRSRFIGQVGGLIRPPFS